MLTAGAIITLIVFIATFLDFAKEPTWPRALPMLVALALFVAFYGARVVVYGASC